MSTKKTVIIGATTNPSRYAYLAAERLSNNGHPIIPVGIKKGEVFGQSILDLNDQPEIADVHTVTLYINPKNQQPWEDYILDLKPKRIIFNPGTENPDFSERAAAVGIETLDACTLVMLSAQNY